MIQLIESISNVGFPIAIASFLIIYITKKFEKVVMNNTIALTKFCEEAEIKRGK